MCGIVLAGGNLTSTDVEVFNQLLYCDVFRGQHSTGVFAKRSEINEVLFYKEALPSFAYLLQKEYKELSTGKTNYTVSPNFLVGHNRHATRGAINSDNAHPFQHGHITLVHNGTLVNQSLLPEHAKFEVDSNNIAYSISKIGAEETIQKLDGAYTLVWHDSSDDTLHIIRNEERPFHLCRVGTDWFGASEEDMLMWILKRSKLHKNRIGEHFECKVGVEYIFDVKGKKMSLVEEKAHTLPVFTVASRWGNYSSTNWQDLYYQDERFERHSRNNESGAKDRQYENRSSTGWEMQRKKDIENQNQIAIDRGLDIRRDMVLEFLPSSFTPYSGTYSAGKGKMTGYVFDDKVNEYFEVDVHNIFERDYRRSLNFPDARYAGTISCISEDKDKMIRCVVVGGKWIDCGEEKEPASTAEFDDDIPFDTNATCVTGAGVTVTRKFWESHAHGECGGCGQHIDWKDAPKALFSDQAYWHPDCLNNRNKNKSVTDELALCSFCSKIVEAEDLDVELSCKLKDDICKDCAADVKNKVDLILDKSDNKPEVISEGKDFVWVRAIDKSSPRNNEISLRITPEILKNMIIMVGSTKKEFALSELNDCHIERRAGGVLAIGKFDNKVDLSKSKTEVKTATPAETFRKRSSELDLRKTVYSPDKTRKMEVTKAVWANIGFCEYCYKQVAWKDVEECSLGSYSRIVCPTNLCRGKLNGSQKTYP